MNEFLRLFQRSLRPFGYDIRRRHACNLLPFKGIDPVPALDRVRKNFEHNGETKRVTAGNLDLLKIIYRTCLNHQRNLNAHTRVTAAPLVETVERCFLSLVSSINAALKEALAPQIELLLLDDHSDPDLLAGVLKIAAQLQCPWKLQTTESMGQGASLHQQFALARNDDALYYFCEDDYLHERRAVYEMWAFYRQVFHATGKHLVIHPQEHECLYNSSFYPSYLILSPFRHWRSVSDATHILFMHAHVVRDYWKYFENTKFVGNKKKRKLGSERMTTNRLFDHLPCFVPLPALAGHLQSAHVLPPFFSWQELWVANAPDKHPKTTK
ncbi:MAG: hypothetical protein P4M13_04730 [Alphaproteobacteria bacterium]|nr:hypothetical protein [Alphaproteobacteria bacterium]